MRRTTTRANALLLLALTLALALVILTPGHTGEPAPRWTPGNNECHGHRQCEDDYAQWQYADEAHVHAYRSSLKCSTQCDALAAIVQRWADERDRAATLARTYTKE